MKYRYNEGDILKELTEYVNKTYGEHYATEGFQFASCGGGSDQLQLKAFKYKMCLITYKLPNLFAEQML